MEVIFLGTGTSQGVPLLVHPNIDTESGVALDLANPRNHRTRASIHVVLDGLHVQVDTGPDFRRQCWDNQIPAVDIFLLTHGHADHVVGADDLRRYCDLRNGTAIPTYSTPEGLDRLRAIFPYAVRSAPAATGYVALDLHEMPAELTLANGSTVRSTLLPHGRFQTLGLVFTEKSTGARLAYYSDCAKLTDEAVQLAAGADAAVLDGLRPAPHPTHMCIADAVAAARQINARRTFITHTTYQVDYATWTPRLAPDHVEIAYDGLRLNLPEAPFTSPGSADFQVGAHGLCGVAATLFLEK
ncbi:MAG: MBL fold metallo-hydrolase [Puniceicoccales bacterium]|jgi:phosphoribosyl 1,2-cyclic phosphate phosphodiesterase|nr:MBL fold metallo-hydrolase [Puniceicoccales bacterium]